MTMHMHGNPCLLLPLPVLSLLEYFLFMDILELTSFWILVNLIIENSWGAVSDASSVYSLHTTNISLFCRCKLLDLSHIVSCTLLFTFYLRCPLQLTF